MIAPDMAIWRRTAARLRRELHRIHGRDFFSTPQREAAARAVEDLAAAADEKERA